MYRNVLAVLALLTPVYLQTTPASPWHPSSHQILTGGVFKDNQNKTLKQDGSEGSEVGSGPPRTYDLHWPQHQNSYPPHNDAYGGVYDNHLNNYPNQAYRHPLFNGQNNFDFRNTNIPLNNRLINEDPRYRHSTRGQYPNELSYHPETANGMSNNGQSYNGLSFNHQAQDGQYYDPHASNGLSYDRSQPNPYLSQNGYPNSYSDQSQYNPYSREPNFNTNQNGQDSGSLGYYNPNNQRVEARLFTPQGVLWNAPVRYNNPQIYYRGQGGYWNGPNNAYKRPYSTRYEGYGPYSARNEGRPYQQYSQDPRNQPDHPFTNTAPIQFSNN